MGKGSIISGGENGLYTVTNELYRQRIDSAITRLTNRIADLETKIAEPGQSDEELSPLYAQLASLESRKRLLENLPEDKTQSVWCADFTEDLTGTVGLAEIAYQEDIGLNILPGYAAGTAESPAVYDQARDGAFGIGLGTTPVAAYFNWLMLPWAQVWKPRFRYGTLTGIDYDEDTGTVTLEQVTSRAKGIDVTAKPGMSWVLENVPIQYMNCNAWAFENGDDVLVKFQNYDWDSPVVIGFKDHPRPCYPSKGVYLVEAPRLISGGYSYVALQLTSSVCTETNPARYTQVWEAVSVLGFPGYDYESEIVSDAHHTFVMPVTDCTGVTRNRSVEALVLPEGEFPFFTLGSNRLIGSMAVLPGTTVDIWSTFYFVGEPFATIEGGDKGRVIWFDYDYYRDLENPDCCQTGGACTFSYCTDDYITAAMNVWTGQIAEFFTDGPELVVPLTENPKSIKVR